MSKSLMLLSGVALLAAGPLAAAAPPKAGTPFLLSSCAECRQRNPAVAIAQGADFITAWQGTRAIGADGIPGRSFRADGSPKGTDFPVIDSSGAAFDVDLAAGRDDVVAVWSEGGRVFAQRLSFAGERLGSRIEVSSIAIGAARHVAPAVARAADGSFVVAWIGFSIGTSEARPQVLVRRFDAQGAPKTAAVKVNDGLADDDRPDVCLDTSGRAIVVWSSVDDYRPFLSNKQGVSARRLAANLTPLGGERIVSAPLDDESTAAVSCGRGNTFVIVWQSAQLAGTDRSEILARRYSRIGRQIGATIAVNESRAGEQRQPTVAHEPSGAFTVLWQSDGDDDRGLVGRRISAAGQALSGDFTIATEVDRELSRPSLGFAADGRSVVVWQEGQTEVAGQRFGRAQ